MLTKKKVTKELLANAAIDLNTALVLSPAIPTEGKFTVKVDEKDVEKDVTKATLESDIVEFGKDDLQFDDLAKLKPETLELMVFLGVKLPEAPKGDTTEKDPETGTVGKGKAGKKGLKSNPEIVERNNYIESLIAESKYTSVQIKEMAVKKFPNQNAGGIATVISDSKNAKYNKFAKLAVADPKTKIMSFK